MDFFSILFRAFLWFKHIIEEKYNNVISLHGSNNKLMKGANHMYLTLYNYFKKKLNNCFIIGHNIMLDMTMRTQCYYDCSLLLWCRRKGLCNVRRNHSQHSCRFLCTKACAGQRMMSPYRRSISPFRRVCWVHGCWDSFLSLDPLVALACS